jgi:glycosyltransferase involved in cell wall biosynthesis
VIATRADLVPPEFRQKLRLVRWGANTRAFNPEVDGGPLRARLGIGADKLVVGYTGGFYSWHGLEELVTAAAALADLPVVFLLVGEGQRRAAIEKLVEGAGLKARFIFTGRVAYERVPEHIAACDVCVAPFNPARHGHYGRTGEFIYDPLKVFEYMAMARPVLTLRASNIEAMFQDDRELLLTGPGDAIELTRKLRELLIDPARRKRLGEAARAAVVENYSWSSHADELRGLFREIIAEREQSRRA